MKLKPMGARRNVETQQDISCLHLASKQSLLSSKLCPWFGMSGFEDKDISGYCVGLMEPL